MKLPIFGLHTILLRFVSLEGNTRMMAEVFPAPISDSEDVEDLSGGGLTRRTETLPYGERETDVNDGSPPMLCHPLELDRHLRRRGVGAD